MNAPSSKSHPKIDVDPNQTSLNITREDVDEALSYGSYPDHKMRDLLFQCYKLPAKISHFDYKLHCSYAFHQMDEYVQKGWLIVKGKRHYEPMPGKEEDGQKIIATFNEVLKTLKERDKDEPYIIRSGAALS